MGTTERFTRREFQRILDVTDKQLTYWEKLRLISPRRRGSDKSYDFRDLISLRTAKQLIETGEIIESDASIYPGMHAAQPPRENEWSSRREPLRA